MGISWYLAGYAYRIWEYLYGDCSPGMHPRFRYLFRYPGIGTWVGIPTKNRSCKWSSNSSRVVAVAAHYSSSDTTEGGSASTRSR
eukprot:1242394-Rhodomonas_salina.1